MRPVPRRTHPHLLVFFFNWHSIIIHFRCGQKLRGSWPWGFGVPLNAESSGATLWYLYLPQASTKKKKRAEKTQRCRKCRQCHLSAARSGNIFMWHASCKVWQHGNLSAPSLQHLYLLTPTSTTYPSRRLLPQSAFRAPGGFIWDPSRDCHLNATLSRRNLGVWPGQIWGALCTHKGLSMGTHVARAPWRGADPEEQWNYPFGCFKWGWMHKYAQQKTY